VNVNRRLTHVPAEPALTRAQWIRGNAARYFAYFQRKPRFAAKAIWRQSLRLGVGTVVLAAIIAATMTFIDARAVTVAQRVPERLIEIFSYVTDFGKSFWFLVPIALALAAIALFTSPTLPRMSQRVLAFIAVRLGFLFLAIGLPGLFFSVAKRLIGRARPLVEGSAAPFSFRPLSWSVEYASLPSGHSIDAFAAAAAIGALWPWTRPFMWTYAIIIGVSRVVLTAHFPSDVLAGAVVGVVGVLLVRDWFATRGLAFVLGTDGIVRPLPGPSLARIKKVARQLMAP
jgi:membrane-associated phospholipid phosphatase